MSKFTKTQKAYKNQTFLNSSKARNIRILCELEETNQRLKANHIQASILFFGSARAKCRVDYDAEMSSLNFSELQEELTLAKSRKDEESIEKITAKIKSLTMKEWMCEYYEKISSLSRKLTEWSLSSSLHLAQERTVVGVSRTSHDGVLRRKSDEDITIAAALARSQVEACHYQNLVVCTGGGPGFMEAANRGASEVEGARNMGMGITLPFEEGLNPYVTEELAFEYHYFFTRKFWMVHSCQALVVAPGGVGTLDELFEVLTLKQTGKVQKDLPVILFGTEYWSTIINWQSLIKFGTVSQSDYDDLFFTDDVDDAMEYIISRLVVEEDSKHHYRNK